MEGVQGRVQNGRDSGMQVARMHGRDGGKEGAVGAKGRVAKRAER